ncbi:hypothetical protein [Pseudomonas putida]|uniref:Uncharacterized protein n=1 Tax=Pseudomonas putida TaxID=303 RepID=A0A8I1JIQ0_PSEPU|nr:hypothetical protein [Pseudomonas putida]MBI6882774.1 hypothetical protein [Pseudomonas putida]
MQHKAADAIIASVFKETLAELKAGKEVNMNFYLFFEDSYWRFPDDGLSKEEMIGAVNLMINVAKPQAYALVSDTFVRSPETNEIMYEQLLASIVEQGQDTRMIAQRYDRLPSGKISLSRPRQNMDGMTFGGRMTELFKPVPKEILDSAPIRHLLQPYIDRLKKERVMIGSMHMHTPGNC